MVKERPMQEKSTFQTTIETELGRWMAQVEEYSKKIEELKAKAEHLERDAKLQYLEQIKDLENKVVSLKTKMAEGQQRFDEIKSASEEAWGELKTGSQLAWDDLVFGVNAAWKEIRSTLDSASSKLQERIQKK